MAKTHQIPKVLLLVETSRGFGRAVIEGVTSYVREHGPWSIYFEERDLLGPLPVWFKDWRGDGIICRSATPELAKKVRTKQLPTVELLGTRETGFSDVISDHNAEGRLAVEHLLSCGLRELAFFAFGETWWIEQRRRGFQNAVEAFGLSCKSYHPPEAIDSTMPFWDNKLNRSILCWLHSLPSPVGIFAVHDLHALRLLDVCRSDKIAVPEQVAILGCDNDTALCNVAFPPLSSVVVNGFMIGYKAAERLDQMISGRKRPEKPLLIPPIGVAMRQSTDIIAVEDVDVSQAAHYIRQHACRGIKVNNVVDQVSLSRRVLERRFRQHLGRTIKDEILRVQMDRSHLLLSQTDFPIDTVSRKCGFSSARHFITIFHQRFGMTPVNFRNNSRGCVNKLVDRVK
jgi:LacI family transcriptional regulator